MIPIQFEYVDTVVDISDESGKLFKEYEVKKFVVVLSTFKHHYSGSFMYRIRTDYIGPFCGDSRSDEKTLAEDEILRLLKTRVTEE